MDRARVLTHLDNAARARQTSDDRRTPQDRRQEAVVIEQREALSAAKLLTDDDGAQQALVRIVYDLPGASASQKLAQMLARLSERQLRPLLALY